MSKVYVLLEKDSGKVGEPVNYIGVVSKAGIANKFINQSPRHLGIQYFGIPLELDDPELLNRIAKENNENKNKK